MRRLLMLLALLVLASSVQAKERAFGYCEDGSQTVLTDGITSTTLVQRSYPPCRITVYNAGTVVLATLCSDNLAICTPLGNPFNSTSTGYWFFYALNGRYDVHFDSVGVAGCPAGPQCISTPFTHGDYLLCDPVDTVNPCGTGGGTGSVTSFSSGNLTPLFTTSVATPTTTPALTFLPISQNQDLVYASPCLASGNPSFRAICNGDLTNVTFTEHILMIVAGCTNGTAGSSFDLPASNAATAICVTGAVNAAVQGALQFAQTNIAYNTSPIPNNWQSFSTVDMWVASTDTTSGHTIQFTIETACSPTNSNIADDPVWNAAQNFTLITVPVGAVSGQLYYTSVASLTGTGCTGGASPSLLHIRIKRANTDTASEAELRGGLILRYNGTLN